MTLEEMTRDEANAAGRADDPSRDRTAGRDRSDAPAATPAQMREAILHHLAVQTGREAADATLSDWRTALTFAVRERAVPAWMAAQRAAREQGAKRVHYLSMEFLVGRLLEDAVVNMRLDEAAKGAFDELGVAYDAVLRDEPDAALGNGGLGRLAACFLESMATLGCPAFGYGIRYEHGLFRQSFQDGRQVERPETWLQAPHGWEFPRLDRAVEIGFGGTVAEDGARALWTPSQAVRAEPYDTPVIGWEGRFATTLRLWGARGTERFDLDRFNAGDFVAATEPGQRARTISRVLYPDDSHEAGRELRLKQEYFFTSASLRDILARLIAEEGDVRRLPQRVAVQLNDTHPAIAGPELVRLLTDEHAIAFDEAVAMARATLSYTNHTLLPEALERWPEALMARLLPRHMQLIERIDDHHAKANPKRRSSIVEGGEVKMGDLSFVMGHKVNGVSALHTELMKATVFEELHALHPERIVNQTNGVTPRRWLRACNPRLSLLVTETIGRGWEADLERLSDLEPHLDDAAFRTAFAAAKRANKDDLAAWLRQAHGIHADPAAMFDIQIKRIHEYKRQHMNVLETIALWQAMRDEPDADWTPRVKFLAGKAAPAYTFAKHIIRLANDVARIVNADPVTRDRLQLHVLPNYNVTLAERLIPAADLSQQISTAGKEASGTGNMKFALNGAPTIGTLDGANVEIRERVGADNFFLFGMTAEEAMARRGVEDHARRAIAASPRLSRALDAIAKGAFSPDEPERYADIVANLRDHDYFLVASDFDDYWRAQREVDAAFRDAEAWTAMAARNTARCGWFSSDRTIAGYMAQIWDANPLDLA